MSSRSIERLREDLDRINIKILRLLSERGKIVKQIGSVKVEYGQDLFDPEREQIMIEKLLSINTGPYPDDAIRKIFREIFIASLDFMDGVHIESLKVSKKNNIEPGEVKIGSVSFNRNTPVIIAGPCAVESKEQIEETAGFLSGLGVKLLRGGAFKPRTSPYSFQGLEKTGVDLLVEAARKNNMYAVTEVLDVRDVEYLAGHVDMLQVGARNMDNYTMLKELGSIRKPVLLKRGFMSTMEEFMLAAEYILKGGNTNVVLCERGIRTFEFWTKNTLDISAVPILKELTHLPIIVDLSHSTGRKDIVTPLGKAALAAGADGLMLEVHPFPETAFSDRKQQLSFDLFTKFMDNIRPFIERIT